MQKVTQRNSQMGKKLRAYLQLICTNLQELSEEDFSSKKLLIYYIQQGLRPKVPAAFYLNPMIPKDWAIFFAAVAQTKSSF